MGKKNKGKWKDKKNKKKQRTEEGDSKHWRTLGIEERKNLKWEAYYKAQNIVPEDQWDAFEDAFKQPLPISFRLTTSAGAHHRIIQKFEDGEFGGPEKVYEADGRKFGPPTPIPWYPNKCGWTLDISKKDIRKVQELQDFRKFLMEVLHLVKCHFRIAFAGFHGLIILLDHCLLFSTCLPTTCTWG